jgi:GMP synthase-like glutamine amidotransferase
MFKDQRIYKRNKKKFIYGLQGNRIIFKKWDDIQGIKNTLIANKISGIIISGSDYFVNEKGHSIIDDCILKSKIPILAICYGFQYLVNKYGKSSYIKSFANGYRKYSCNFQIKRPFYIPKSKYYFKHTNYIVNVPINFKVIKRIGDKIIVAYNSKRNIFAVQFHPEIYKKSGRAFFKMWIDKCVLYL